MYWGNTDTGMQPIITARVRSTRESNVFTLSVHGGGGGEPFLVLVWGGSRRERVPVLARGGQGGGEYLPWSWPGGVGGVRLTPVRRPAHG